jgi:hypothetical protein
MSVSPTATPVTTPDTDTVATAVFGRLPVNGSRHRRTASAQTRVRRPPRGNDCLTRLRRPRLQTRRPYRKRCSRAARRAVTDSRAAPGLSG